MQLKSALKNTTGENTSWSDIKLDALQQVICKISLH